MKHRSIMDRSLAMKLGLVIWLALWTAGCQSEPGSKNEEKDAPSDSTAVTDVSPSVLAVFDQGQVTADELDQAILALPSSRRQSLTLEDADAFADQVRELAVDKILITEAKLLGVDQSAEFQEQVRGMRRSLVVERYLAKNLPEIEAPSEAEIEQEYRRRAEEFQRVERRMVYNIFRRKTPQNTKDDLRAEAHEIRQQVLQGQGFSSLAERLSESESRHQQGVLGWIRQGEVSEDLEEVLFALPEGVPSEPIMTRDGVHLFYIDVIVEPRTFQIEEVAPRLHGELLGTKQEAAMDALAKGLESDFEVFQPTQEELTTLLQRGRPDTVLLRVDDFELLHRQFLAMLENDRAQRPAAVGNRTEQVLTALRRAELIFQSEEAQGAALEVEDEDVLEAKADQLLAFLARQRKMQFEIERRPEELQTFFEANRMRFTSPLQFEVRRLTVPFSEDSSHQMAILERRHKALDAEELELGDLARELGGEISTESWSSLKEFRAAVPKLAPFAAQLQPGEHSPPATDLSTETLQMIQMVSRRDPQPLTFEQARDRVRATYLQQQAETLYETWRQTFLQQAEFRLVEEHLETFLKTGIVDVPHRLGRARQKNLNFATPQD